MITEVVPGRLYAVGGVLTLDGRITWVPAEATGFQPTGCYVLLGHESPLIIDPGIAQVEAEVKEDLSALIPAGEKVEVFLTRFNADSVGNLGAVADTFDLATVYSSPLLNPLDGLKFASSIQTMTEVRLPDKSRLEVIHAQLRVLSTFWGYDPETRTLFTSDAFTHVCCSTPADPRVVDSVEADGTTSEDVRKHLYATFPWLGDAVTSPIADSVRSLFETHKIDAIAPARGCVLRGRAVVAHHLEMVLDVLSAVPETV